VILSEDQQNALDAIHNRLRVSDQAVLVGAAGTGKTTVMKAFLASLPPSKSIFCCTPTWKAALRFTEVTGRDAMTIHRLIYGAPIEQDRPDGSISLHFSLRGDPTRQIPPGSLVIVDESSMIGTKTYADLMRVIEATRSRVFFVGDREQLEPVNDQWGVNFDLPTAALTRIHRQAEGSSVLRFVTAIREGTVKEFTQYDESVRWLHPKGNLATSVIEGFFASGGERSSKIALSYTNKLRQGLNRIARRVYGIASEVLVPGEILLSFSNAAGLVNGEQVIVKEIRQTDDQSPLWRALNGALSSSGFDVWSVVVCPPGRPEHRIFVFPQALGENPLDHKQLMKPIVEALLPFGLADNRGRLLQNSGGGKMPDRILNLLNAAMMIGQVEYGYACTAHKAQGSQWPHVLVAVEPALIGSMKREADGVAFGRRWFYTACTRTQETLTVVSL
jgi:exodeoxyribonuclease-5